MREPGSAAAAIGFSQLNVRGIATLQSWPDAPAIDAIAEVFNLFNSENPDGFRHASIHTGSVAISPVPIRRFMQPTTYAGDFPSAGTARRSNSGLRFYVSKRLLSILPMPPFLPTAWRFVPPVPSGEADDRPS